MSKTPRKRDQPPAAVVKQVLRFETYRLIARTLTWPLRILAFWWPVQALEPIAVAFAGKDTNVTVSLTIAWAATAGMIGLSGTLYYQNRTLKKRAGEVESKQGDIYSALGLKLEA